MVVETDRPILSSELSTRRPPFLLEQRVGLELLELTTASVFYGVGVPHGNGKPVLFIPGFLGSDYDIFSLTFTNWLSRIGYQAHAAGISQNLGWGSTWHKAENRAKELSRDKPITAIGQSLGGFIARWVAQRLGPEIIDQVITLGTPFSFNQEQPDQTAHPLVLNALKFASLWDPSMNGGAEKFLQEASQPLPSGTQSVNICTEEDGIVNWQYCADMNPKAINLVENHRTIDLRPHLKENPQIINIKLNYGTHTGLIINSTVYSLLGNLILPFSAQRNAAPIT